MKTPNPKQFKNLHKKAFVWIFLSGLVGLFILSFLFSMDNSSGQSVSKLKNISSGEPSFLNRKPDSLSKPIYGLLTSNTALKNSDHWIPPSPKELFGGGELEKLKTNTSQESEKKVVVRKVIRKGRGYSHKDNEKNELSKIEQQALRSPIGFTIDKQAKSNDDENIFSSSKAQKYLAKAQEIKQSLGTGGGVVDRGYNHSNNQDISSRFKVPKTPYTLLEGTLIPATLVTSINSDLPGDIIAVVNRNVYDSIRQKYLLIPKGSKLIGSYDERVVLNQHKLLLSWDRIIFPDGRSLSLPSLNTYDLKGRSGLAGKVNNHFWKIFGQSAMLSLIGAATSVATQNGTGYSPWGRSSPGEIAGSRIAKNFNRIANKVLEKNLQLSPTITIKSGTRFNVFLAGDISFKHPYEYNPVGQ